MHYRLAAPKSAAVQSVIREVIHWLHTDKQMQRDRAKLAQACCAPQKFVLLEHAPLPTAAISLSKAQRY